MTATLLTSTPANDNIFVKTMSHWRSAMNIGDIAEMAGVSRAAVSRYLNNGYISAEKSEKIRKVIERTGYKPSVMAQTLRTKKTMLIGVVLPRINSDSISSIVAGIGTALNASGYEMLLATTDNNSEKELEFLRIFSNNRVDGVIFIATVFTKEHRKILKNMTIPVVIVGQQLGGYSCIYHDDYGAGRALAEHVLAAGRRKLAYIGVLKEDVAVGQQRFDGVREAAAEAGIEIPPERTEIAEFSAESGHRCMQRILAESPDLDAVICATDGIAIGAMQCLKEHGRRVPEDVAVAGFGDNVISSVTTPTLTTVHLYYREAGETAAKRIVERIDGKEKTTVEIKQGFKVIERGSTKRGPS